MNNRAMYIIDEEYRIVYTNEQFRQYYQDVSLHQKCYRALGHLEHICPNCPLYQKTQENAFYNTATKEWIYAQTVKMEQEDGRHYHAVFFELLRDDLLREGSELDAHCREMLENLMAENAEACILGQYCQDGFPIFYASGALLRLLGYESCEEMLSHRGSSALDFIHPDDADMTTRRILGNNPHSGMNYSISYRMQRKDGSYFCVADRGFVVEEDDCLLLISQLSDMSGMLRMQTTIEQENRALQQQNLELKYMKNRRPDAYHCCEEADDFPFREISEQFCELTGYTREELRRRFDDKLYNMVVPEDRNKLNAALVMHEIGSTCEIHYRLQTKSRGIIWVKGNVRLSEFGGERFYQGTIVEITAEMETQRVLEQRNRELELILSAIPGGLKHIEANEEFSYRFLSEGAAALFGYTVEEMMEASGGNAMGMVYPEDRELVRTELRQCLAQTTTDYSVKYRIMCRDGSLKYILGCGRLAQDEDGKPYFQSLYIDLTREKENEDMIQQLQLIRALSNDYSDVYVVDLENGILIPVFQHETSVIAHLTNECYEVWLQQLCEETVHPEDREQFLQKAGLDEIRTQLTSRDMFHHDYRNAVDNEVTYWQIKCVRIGDEGTPVRAIIGFRNIDEDVRIERERSQALRDALNQAQYANKAKTTFLNNMSHDIRTPMNAIIGFTTLAAAHIDNKERVRDYLRKITHSSNHLLSLINDVLDMSRIESGKMNIAEKPENLSEILCEIKNIMQADVHAKQLKFEVLTFDIVNEMVYCDKLRINQIILNLLSNAVKFTAPGGRVAMHIFQRSCTQEDMAVYEFRFTDTGIGMEKEFLQHIFEPFAQERSSTVSGIQGTGLGMAITKNIVDMCGGTIAVESDPGIGTEIIVTLQFRIVGSASEPEQPHIFQGMRALVVDDEMNACKSVSRMLRRLGMRVDWTVCGSEAVVRAEEAIEIGEPYQVFVVDWVMSDMNGIETTRRLRRVIGKQPPIIVLSAYDYTDIEPEGREAGVTEFACKPLFLSELRRVLLHVCNVPAEENPLRGTERIQGRRVLVAEDNEINQEITVDILSTVGVLVDIAENGAAALEMLQSKGAGFYDLVLMDIQMPVMDGYEAARQIRLLPDPMLAEIPIIAMTANAFDEDRVLAFEAGMNGHIPKPIEIDKLLSTIEYMIKP